jgi:uncharacterized protein
VRAVFVDTFYWVALLVPGDQWRARAIAVTEQLGPVQMVTTQEVLTELLNFAAGAGPRTRQRVTAWIHGLPADPSVRMIVQSDASFQSGLELYQRRPDKSYSLTDCISMQTMRAQGITEVLTHDHHFQQEGFTVLL